MPAPLEEGSDGDTIELRVYIKVSKRGHPELASLLAGLNKREQSRLVSALVFRGAIVSAQPASVATMQVATAYVPTTPTARPQTGGVSVAASVQGTSELMDGPRWPGQIPPPLATPNSPRQDGRIMTMWV